MKKESLIFILKTAFIAICILSLAVILTAHFSEKIKISKFIACKENLGRIGHAQAVYVSDFGRNVRYPPYNGAGFLTTLYKVGIVDEKVFLCPSTSDKNDGDSLLKIVDCDLDENLVSYSGRKNRTQFTYPGLFRVVCFDGIRLTPIAADDIQGSKNHGDAFNFLFIDGHVKNIKEDSTERYYPFEWAYDPLTN